MSSDRFETLASTRAGAKRVYLPQKRNEDRVIIREFTGEQTRTGEPGVLIAVADGVSRCADGGAVANWVLEERIKSDDIFALEGDGPLKSFHGYLGQMHSEFLETFRLTPDMLESGATFSAVLIVGNEGAAYWAGDSPIYHFQPNGGDGFNTTSIMIPDKDPLSGALTDCFSGVTPFAVKQAMIQPQAGDIYIAASDGIAYDGEDLALTISQSGFNKGWLETVCQLSYEVALSDDVSLTAVRVS